MKEPEISTRITELKNEFQEETDKKLAQFDQHGERLMALESEFGFDLDVATDIYGDTLLDPNDPEKVVEQWANLLGAIKENPGKPLVLIRETSIPTNINVNSHFPALKHSNKDVEAALIPNVSLDNFSYHPASEDKQAYIAITAKDIRLHSPFPRGEMKRGFVYSSEDEDSVIVANEKDLVTFYRADSLCITDNDCHTLYDPSWQSARGLVDSISQDLSSLSTRFFNPLRHLEKVDSQKT